MSENTISVSTLNESDLTTFLSNIVEAPPYFAKNTKTKIAALKRSLDVAEAIRRAPNVSSVAETEVNRAIQSLNVLQTFIASNVQDLTSILNMRSSPRRSRAEETIRSLSRRMPVRFEYTLVIIETGPITIRHNGMLHEMGEFTIKMRANARDWNGVSITGTKLRDGTYHPHVSGTGQPCFGNIKPMVGNLIKECEFEELSFLLIDFLKSYSENNPYRNISYWRDGYCSNCYELRTFCTCTGEEHEEEEEEEEEFDDENDEYYDDEEEESDDF